MIRNKLKELRSNKRISGEQLAGQVGVSRSYIAKLEKGLRRPSIKVAFELGKYFDCPVEDIFYSEPDN